MNRVGIFRSLFAASVMLAAVGSSASAQDHLGVQQLFADTSEKSVSFEMIGEPAFGQFGEPAYSQQAYRTPPTQAFMPGVVPTGYGSPYGPQGQIAPQLSQGYQLGGGSSMNFYGSPDPSNPNIGSSYSMSNSDGMIRQATAAGSFHDTQQTYQFGLTAVLAETSEFALAVRGMAGGASYNELDDRFRASGDIYMAHRIGDSHNWIKYGAFYDHEEGLNRIGPLVGALFGTNTRHPWTIDFALGFGMDNQQTDTPHQFYQGAQYDGQIRVGTFLMPQVQGGFSLNYLNWDSKAYGEDEFGAGAFCNVFLGQWQIQLDLSGDKEGAHGFAHVVYHFGRPANRAGNLTPANPQDWMLRPVMRDTGIRVRRRNDLDPNINGVGNITAIACVVRFPGFNTGPDNGDGIVQAGEGFEVDFLLTNNTGRTATNVSFGQNAAVIGNGAQIGFVGGFFGNLAPGESARTDPLTDACIAVLGTAVDGDEIFVEFNVTADGQTRRFRCGPFIVGQISDGDTGDAVPVGAAAGI